jgi:hypothetical protein
MACWLTDDWQHLSGNGKGECFARALLRFAMLPGAAQGGMGNC